MGVLEFVSKIVVNNKQTKDKDLVRKEKLVLRKDKVQNRNIFMLLRCTKAMFLLISFFYDLVITCFFYALKRTERKSDNNILKNNFVSNYVDMFYMSSHNIGLCLIKPMEAEECQSYFLC